MISGHACDHFRLDWVILWISSNWDHSSFPPSSPRIGESDPAAICSHSVSWLMQSKNEGNPCTSAEKIEGNCNRNSATTFPFLSPSSHTLSCIFFLTLYESVTDVKEITCGLKNLSILSPCQIPLEIIHHALLETYFFWLPRLRMWTVDRRFIIFTSLLLS